MNKDVANTYSYTHTGMLISHKSNEVLPFSAACMDLGGIMLSEISQRKCIMPIICEI